MTAWGSTARFEPDVEWLNSAPLGPEELRGHVVLVNFWTLTCINWLRQVPYVRAWSEGYRDDGLIVIGVHTPEFAFEQDVAGIRQAAKERRIDYPIVVDSEYAVWQAFDNHYWPALYFIDESGEIRDSHFGEGRYDRSEQLIQELLGIDRPPVPVAAVGVEAAADWTQLRTAETYVGDGRSAGFASPGGVSFGRRVYELPDRLHLNNWALAGDWAIESERAVLGTAGGRIAFRFQARDAHLVLANGAGTPIPFRVLVDGQPPGESHGVDVSADGNGVLEDGRLYQLVRVRDEVRERTLEVTFLEPGAEAYVFTFG
ncbi:redoxin family protein [Kribbella sp. NPDC051952]|uniref:redoxin family protein n=1 Tax=Kribbella sp. NPDC051952 TaxID=3154851 RepID=UPI003420F46E